jgi:hypothetical protein
MRERKVLGLIPRISAAPFFPWITQPVSLSALAVVKRGNKLLSDQEIADPGHYYDDD